MGINLRLPNITGLTEKEQVLQMRNYLYQLVGELQFAFNDTSSASSNVVASSQQNGGTAVYSNIDVKTAFPVLKSLIIKSADIVDAYYDEISKRLEGVYVAQSDFGTYKEETTQAISATSSDITQAFDNIQTINTTLSGEVSGIKKNVEDTTKALSDSISATASDLEESIGDVSENLGGKIDALTKNVDALLTVNAYIKSGRLYYNDEGLPVYGIEVGQTNNVNGEDVFKKFARFTADRLSFYDQNNDEVAYISDYKLYITSVEILYNLIGGGFMLDFSRGFTLKYAGGE